MKVEGLRMFQAVSPFKDYFGTVLDLDGPWTGELSDADSSNDLRLGDTNEPTHGLSVWEGSCEVTNEDPTSATISGVDQNGDEVVENVDLPAYRRYVFAGTWRAPTLDEVARIARGLTPLRGVPFHPLEKRLTVEETFKIRRTVDDFVSDAELPEETEEGA